MNDYKHTVLLVDDEEKIVNSLKRLLRKEGYQLLIASSGAEGLKVLEGNDVHLVISDQRMPQMSGTEFFAMVKERYPDAIRIILTGYTDVDSITESVNRGHVYKFFLKPWNDQSLKLEIKSALEQYDLIQANKELHERVIKQNEELQKINENLEMMVKERTEDLEIQNQVLELSRAILEDLTLPIIGVSAEGLIVVVNRESRSLSINGQGIEIGKEINDYLSPEVKEKIISTIKSNTAQTIKDYQVSATTYNMDVTPLSGKFRDKGIILSLRQANKVSQGG